MAQGASALAKLRCLGLAIVLLVPSAAPRAETFDDSIKAAFLPRFAPFIEWPDSAFAAPGAPISLCVLGRDPFGTRLEQTVTAATAGKRPIEVRRVTQLDAESRCQMIYLAAGSDETLVTSTLEAMRGHPVVTVTDAGMSAHGVISFVMENRRVRFDIDDALAAEGGLSISSKLLSLAHAVKTRVQP